jgi:anaerobic ribonucleoside-triphosphate reductase
MKKCLNGSKDHEHCEDVVFEGTKYVVCHVCEQTLGRKSEVYSRVCGYLRPTDGWNPGKKAEHSLRKPYLMKMPS